MTATHWIAIAAIIMPLITSWLQFWFGKREPQSSTATPKPAVIHRRGFRAFVRRNRRMLLIQWGVNSVFSSGLIFVWFWPFPITRGYIVLVSVLTTLWGLAIMAMAIRISRDEEDFSD